MCVCFRAFVCGQRQPTIAYSSILISLFAYYECNTSFCLSKTKNTAIFLCEANWVWNTMCVRICIVLSVYNSTFYSPKCVGRIYFYCVFPAVCTNNEMAAAKGKNKREKKSKQGKNDSSWKRVAWWGVWWWRYRVNGRAGRIVVCNDEVNENGEKNNHCALIMFLVLLFLATPKMITYARNPYLRASYTWKWNTHCECVSVQSTLCSEGFLFVYAGVRTSHIWCVGGVVFFFFRFTCTFSLTMRLKTLRWFEAAE